MVLPIAASQMNQEASHKEGWLSGIAEAVLKRREENGIQLSVAFPIASFAMPRPVVAGGGSAETEALMSSARRDSLRAQLEKEGFCEREITWEGSSFFCYGFREDTDHAEKYDPVLEQILEKIVYRVKPDVVHCFGTEYPHTLAMCRSFPEKRRLLVGLQGLCTLCAEGYFADLPESVVRSVTFRDLLKRDTLKRQQEKFVLRGRSEREALSLAGNITGRTEWDRAFARKWNPEAHYYFMNEILRKEFYGPVWEAEQCEPHAIFLSQGDYPLKGLHYMLAALPRILEKYPDAKVYVAGSSLVEFRTIKQKLKLSAYGKYLRKLLKSSAIQEKVEFLGKLNAGQMRDVYLKSGLFVCCSSLENSPNSLGEAMLLGMPCVSAKVGGIPSIFVGGQDGILFEGYKMPTEAEFVDKSTGKASGDGETARDEACREKKAGRPEAEEEMAVEYGEEQIPAEERLEAVGGRLARAVVEMWGDPAKQKIYCANAREHARKTHDRESNYRRMIEIYEQIIQGGDGVQLY